MNSEKKKETPQQISTSTPPTNPQIPASKTIPARKATKTHHLLLSTYLTLYTLSILLLLALHISSPYISLSLPLSLLLLFIFWIPQLLSLLYLLTTPIFYTGQNSLRKYCLAAVLGLCVMGVYIASLGAVTREWEV